MKEYVFNDSNVYINLGFDDFGNIWAYTMAPKVITVKSK